MKNTYVGVLAVVGSLIIGEYLQPVSVLKENITYHNVPIAKDFPVDPWNYQVQREIIEEDGKTYQGLFLVNNISGVHKRITTDGCTCGVGMSIDDFVKDTKEWIGEKVDKTKKWFSHKDTVK